MGTSLVSCFETQYTYQWQVARKTQSLTSWRPIINETKANVVLEEHTIQYNIQKTYRHRESKRQSAKRKLKWRTAAMCDSRNNINDIDKTRNFYRV